LLLSEPEERDEQLTSMGLTEDERRVLIYYYVRLPAANLNKPPTPPFPNTKLKRLLQSEVGKYIIYTTMEAMSDEVDVQRKGVSKSGR